MITIHQNSSQNQYRTMAYGLVDPMTVQWCNDRVDKFRSELHPEAQEYYQNLKGTVFERLDYSSLHRNLLVAQRTQVGLWGEEVIHTHVDIEAIQHLPDIMIDYVMANPVISDYYDRQQIAGFDERYKDPYPKLRGEDNPIYRAVMNGVFVETGNDDEMVCKEWIGCDEQDRYTLDLFDQVSIMETWNSTIAWIKHGGEDPTSANNAAL